MRRHRLAGFALLAGLVLAGGGAFTASNTFTNGSDIAGYGTNTVTGAEVSLISYNHVLTNASELASVVFTLTTNITGDTAAMQLLNSSGGLVGDSPYSCSLGTWSVVTLTIVVTCDTNDNPQISAFDSVGLAVHQ
jgi:hypothetical protein